MLLQAAEAGLGPDTPEPARRQISLAAETARENLAEARGLVAALAPADLASGNLPGALRRVTERLGGRDRHRGDVHRGRRAAGRCPPRWNVVLLRVAQEALANVRKHAEARTVRVSLRYTGGAVWLQVSDDGRGFAVDGATSGVRAARDARSGWAR